jgi:hypothetical protein
MASASITCPAELEGGEDQAPEFGKCFGFCPVGKNVGKKVEARRETGGPRKLWKRLAEGVGFEPTEPFGSAVFKTAAFNRSATPPLPAAAGVSRSASDVPRKSKLLG